MSSAPVSSETVRSINGGIYYDPTSLPLYACEEGWSNNIRHASVSHWHDGVELIHVLSGGMHCCINDVELELQSGDFCFINRRQMHVADSGSNGDFRAHVIVFDPTVLTHSEAVYNRYIAPVLEDESFSHFHLSHAAGTAADPGQLVDEITELFNTRPEAYELAVIGLLHLLFQKIQLRYAHNIHELEPLDADAAIQRRMSSFIYDHYAEKLSLDDIAAAGLVSRSKCSQVFRQYLHKSPIDFLNLYRLEVASRLLRNTNDSISSISTSCGFNQQSYFNRLFGRTYGCTPREYREQFVKAS